VPFRAFTEADGSTGLAETGRLASMLDLWLRRCSTLLVADVAAYCSYEHHRLFAATGGGDPTAAGLWPLSVVL
jgi:hypothetical protein